MRSIAALFLYAGLPALILGCARDRELPAEQYVPVEMSFPYKSQHDTAYYDANLEGVFVHESLKDTMRIEGFWYNEDQVKVRFTPTSSGVWNYTINRQNRKIVKGTLKVAANTPRHHGFLRRDSNYPYSFVFDDGQRYFMFGTTYYNMVLNTLAGEKWKTAIDSALVYGINKIRVFVNSEKSPKTPYPQRYPFAKANGKLDYAQLEPDYWNALDRIVQYAFNKGMVVDLILFGYGAECYFKPDLEQQYVRYVIARYGAYPNVIWCLVNEWNYMSRDFGKGKPSWNAIGNLIRREDPYMEVNGQLRPLSIHQQTRIDFQFFDYPWPVHAVVQLGVRNGQGTVADEWDNRDPVFQTATRYGDEWGNRSITYNMGHNMPVVNDEFGYIGEPLDRSGATSRDTSTWPALTRTKHRNIMWGIVLAGGYGTAGDKNQYADGYPYFSANWHSIPPEYGDIKILTDFFNSGKIEYWKMKGANEMLTSGERVYALAEAGRQYLFYTAAGNPFKATIDPGTYQVTRLNPRDGSAQNLGIIEGAEFKANPDAPDDWVFFLKKTDEKN